LSISLDETVTEADLKDLFEIFGVHETPSAIANKINASSIHALQVSKKFQRTTPYLTHESFNKYHSEHELVPFLSYQKKFSFPSCFCFCISCATFTVCSPRICR